MPAGLISRGLLGLAALAALSLAVVRPAVAQDGGSQETLRTLYRIALSAEMCGFPIAQRQAEALGRAMDRALADSGMDEAASEAFYRDLDAAFETEGWEKICAENGSWARGYRALLAANTR